MEIDKVSMIMQTVGEFVFSDPCNEVVAALAIAQGKFVKLTKDKNVKVEKKSGGHYSFKFSDLDSIESMIRLPLAENGIFHCQPTRIADGKCAATTVLMHKSGQWIRFPWIEFRATEGPQGQGGLLTYAKRYSLTGALAVTSDDDNDGNSAEGNVYSYQDSELPDDRHRVNPKETTRERNARVKAEKEAKDKAAANGHAKPTPAELNKELENRFDGGAAVDHEAGEAELKVKADLERLTLNRTIAATIKDKTPEEMAAIIERVRAASKEGRITKSDEASHLVRALVKQGDFDAGSAILQVAMEQNHVRGEESTRLHQAIEQGRKNAEKGGFVGAT
jgi:hypothetical protein